MRGQRHGTRASAPTLILVSCVDCLLHCLNIYILWILNCKTLNVKRLFLCYIQTYFSSVSVILQGLIVARSFSQLSFLIVPDTRRNIPQVVVIFVPLCLSFFSPPVCSASPSPPPSTALPQTLLTTRPTCQSELPRRPPSGQGRGDGTVWSHISPLELSPIISILMLATNCKRPEGNRGRGREKKAVC